MGVTRYRMEDEQPELAQTIIRTGYVIELERGRYFARWQNGSICCLPVEHARYFIAMEQAEHYVQRYLGFPGMRVHICRVCWTLIETESLECEWKLIKANDGSAVMFAAYQDAKKYQTEHALEENSIVEFHVFREKELFLAA